VRPQRPPAFVAQLQHAVDCVTSGVESELISAPSARQALAVCFQEIEAARTGQTMNIAL